MAPQTPEIPIATHHLLAFATQAEVLQHVRTQALDEESQRLQEILELWKDLQPRVADLLTREAGTADTILIEPIPEEHKSLLAEYASDPLFQKTFASLPAGFGYVEVDKLVAPQRTVNLDYVDRLVASYNKLLTERQLLDICVSPKRTMDAIQHLEIAPNTHVFSSPNSDIRCRAPGAYQGFLRSGFRNHAEGSRTDQNGHRGDRSQSTRGPSVATQPF
jgi:hypothetical protein